MRGVASLSPAADMPLAFLVVRIGVACLADLWRIELQCDLPCKPFRLYPDAPLAHLIGTPAKQGWEKGETSLGSPPILRLAAFASASPLANQKWKGLLQEATPDQPDAASAPAYTRRASPASDEHVA